MPLALKDSERRSAPAPTFGDALLRNLEQAMRKSAQWTGLQRVASLHPSEYGLFVQMVKK